MPGHIATAQIDIAAPPSQVWAALTEPKKIKEYMFGTNVETDWKAGSQITWKGEYEGKTYEDKGEIRAIEPLRRLEMTHFSPLSGQEDIPENYHTLVYELEEQGDQTRVYLSQDGNASEEQAEHSQNNWQSVLAGLKKVVEGA